MARLRMCWLLVLLALWGCSSDQRLIALSGANIDVAAIDRDPTLALPADPLLVGQLDAARLFASGFGREAEALILNLVPLTVAGGFAPSRDVKRIVGGLYAMQGADFVAVLQGNFDVPGIKRAVAAHAQSRLNSPVVVVRYAGFELFTLANLGFVPLSSHTLIAGNETGIRRALDHLRYGDLKEAKLPWVGALLRNREAAFAVGGDLTGQPAMAAASAEVPFLRGLQEVRVLGNFAPPGMNVVGTMSYLDDDAAIAGAASLAKARQMAYLASLMASWGMGGGMPELVVARDRQHVSFATKLDTRLVSTLLEAIGNTLRSALEATAPATGT